MNEEKKSNFFGFASRMIIAYFLTYFFVGVIFYLTGLQAIVYFDQNITNQLVTDFHRQTSSIWVVAGPLFQILRGLLFSIALFPFRNVFLEKKLGWLYLWILLIVFGIISPFGESPGSIEGVVYTNLPISFHLLYLPDNIIQALSFTLLFITWEKHKLKLLTIPLLIIFFFILLINLIGVIKLILTT